VYYPGALYDGHAVKIFGAAGAAHCFVYVDFAYSLAELCNTLDATDDQEGYMRGFLGYRSQFRLNVDANQLLAAGWNPPDVQLDYPDFAQPAINNPFAILEILERNESYGEDHGPRRLAILFIAGCAFRTFYALFTRNLKYKPFGILLQDHGFSGNPDAFGRNGLLERIAQDYNKRPKYLLVTEQNEWHGYRRVRNLDAEQGGMHNSTRSLSVRGRSA
jgi:hypothetical protein